MSYYRQVVASNRGLAGRAILSLVPYSQDTAGANIAFRSSGRRITGEGGFSYWAVPDRAGKDRCSGRGDDHQDQPTQRWKRPQLPAKITFTVVVGKYPGQRYNVSGEAVIGRDEAADIFLADPTVSQRHARVVFRDGQYFIEDLDSTNGTVVNGQRVESRMLQSGDRVKIGLTELVVTVLS